MSDISDAALHDPAGTRDFGEGVSESPFGLDAGAGGSLRDHAANRLKAFADQGKAQVTDSLDGLVEAVREIAGKVGGGPLEGYANEATAALERWAGGIKDKSVDDLIDEGREFARTQPALAVGIAVAAGFALSRFLKAST